MRPLILRWPRGRFEWIALGLVGAMAVAGATCAWWMGRYAIKVHRLTRGVGDTVFYAADGQAWFRLDEQRHDVTIDKIAPNLQRAVVAIEDRRFFQHPGLDPIGIGRALMRDVRSRSRVEGGSTITQQLARTLFLSNARTYARKIKEAAIALLIEAQLSKTEILELYLNRIYLGAGVYGVEAMSEHLYRKPSANLTLAEAALVAGLIKAPSALSPWTNYDEALERSHLVLRAMRELQFITAGQEQAALVARPAIQPYRGPNDLRAAWAKDLLRQQFRNEFDGDNPPDWQVHTTFRPSVQDAAEQAVAISLQRLNRRDLEVALVAMDPVTGDLLAIVGGSNYARSTFNRAIRSRRQPGSAFKPFVFAAALARGYSPVSVLKDLDRVVVPEDPEWRPRTVAHDEEGARQPLTLRVALAESNNAAAVALQQDVGTSEVLKLAALAGLSDLPDVPSLALGTGSVTPIDLATAYTMFPGGGEIARPRGMLQVFDPNGYLVFDRPIERERVLSEPVAFQMVSLLQEVVNTGTGASARALGLTGPFAGKTGTTDDYRDAWFVGFSSSVVAAVWVGLDQPASIGREAYGARIALPIWTEFMKRTARELPAHEFPIPDDIRGEELCSVSHLRPVDGCPVYTEYFKEGDDVPSQMCPIHKGSLKQAAARAVTGFFRRLGGIFRRR